MFLSRIGFSTIYIRPLVLVACLLAAFALSGMASLASEIDERYRLPVLQFRSLDGAWLRYFHPGDALASQLEADTDGILLFRRVVSDYPLGEAELGNPQFVAWLVYTYGLSFDATLTHGECDTEKLMPKSSDILCMPGGVALPLGYVYLTLYHPRTYQIVALTTTIDNSIGGATFGIAGWVNPNPAGGSPNPDANITDSPSNNQQPASGNAADACGSYVAGQWITAADYAASELNLPVNRQDVGNPVTDYACVVPEDGGLPYLEAYSFVPDRDEDEGEASDRAEDDDDDDDDDDEDDRFAASAVIDC